MEVETPPAHVEVGSTPMAETLESSASPEALTVEDSQVAEDPEVSPMDKLFADIFDEDEGEEAGDEYCHEDFPDAQNPYDSQCVPHVAFRNKRQQFGRPVRRVLTS